MSKTKKLEVNKMSKRKVQAQKQRSKTHPDRVVKVKQTKPIDIVKNVVDGILKKHGA